jgi:hypothetical protein
LSFDFGIGVSQIKKGRRSPLLFASSPFDKIPDYFFLMLFLRLFLMLL